LAKGSELRGRGYAEKLGEPDLLFTPIRRKDKKRLLFGEPPCHQRTECRKWKRPLETGAVCELLQQRRSPYPDHIVQTWFVRIEIAAPALYIESIPTIGQSGSHKVEPGRILTKSITI
jgi:hypothetical protein